MLKTPVSSIEYFKVLQYNRFYLLQYDSTNHSKGTPHSQIIYAGLSQFILRYAS